MNQALAQLERPFRLKKLRYWLSSGHAREFHSLSLFEARVAKRWWRLITHQFNIAVSSNACSMDEEINITIDMLSVFFLRFGRRIVINPGPVYRNIRIQNVRRHGLISEDFRFRDENRLRRIFQGANTSSMWSI